MLQSPGEVNVFGSVFCSRECSLLPSVLSSGMFSVLIYYTYSRVFLILGSVSILLERSTFSGVTCTLLFSISESSLFMFHAARVGADAPRIGAPFGHALRVPHPVWWLEMVCG